MFVQIIQAHTSNPAGVQEAFDRWQTELAPGATGWLGSTGGITDDGTMIAVARFESEEAAQRNSHRPEQDQWWSQLTQSFDSEPIFIESSDVIEDVVGDPDQAGFVQVMKGQGTDPERARELMGRHHDEWAQFRPDMLGSVTAMNEDGRYTMAMYFTSEAEARVGEKKEPPAELKADMDEMMSLSRGQPEFFDLKHPWISSP
jgi:hypothetical protein